MPLFRRSMTRWWPLATHLSPSSDPSWKSRPLLPTKPCRTTSTLIRKSYMVAGQVGASHHSTICQAYQADVLKEMDEGAVQRYFFLLDAPISQSSNRSVALDSLHNPIRLHTSVLSQPPCFDRVHFTAINSKLEASVLQQESPHSSSRVL